MHTLSSFLTAFPEFEPTDTTVVQSALDASGSWIADEWGELENEYHGLLTAERLYLSPFGMPSKQESPETASPYTKRLRQMRAAYACGRNRAV